MLLYYITDRKGFGGSNAEQRNALLRKIADAAVAGVDYIQLREQDLPARELEHLTKEASAAVRENSTHTKLLVNSRTDVALACGADGVHLRASDLAASEARAMWGNVCKRTPLIGVSAHDVAGCRYAEAHGADFAVLAPVFEKTNTNVTPLGLDILRVACTGVRPAGGTESEPRSDFRILALGGVSSVNAGACMAAGAAGVASIRLFQTGDIRETVRRLRAS